MKMKFKLSERSHIIYEGTAPSTIKTVFVFSEDNLVEKQVCGLFTWLLLLLCVCFFLFFFELVFETRKLNHTYSEKITSNEQVVLACFSVHIEFFKSRHNRCLLFFPRHHQCEYKRINITHTKISKDDDDDEKANTQS